MFSPAHPEPTRDPRPPRMFARGAVAMATVAVLVGLSTAPAAAATEPPADAVPAETATPALETEPVETPTDAAAEAPAPAAPDQSPAAPDQSPAAPDQSPAAPDQSAPVASTTADPAIEPAAVPTPAAFGPENSLPTALSDFYSTVEGQPLHIDAPGVLANDFDDDGDALAALDDWLTDSEHGFYSMFGDGSFNYTPDAGFVGQDRIPYTVVDEHYVDGDPIPVESQAFIFVDVKASNTSPTANDDEYTATKNQPLFVAPALGVLTNDSDAEGDTIGVTDVTPVSHGSVSVGVDGRFDYYPALNYTGPDSFTYRISDGMYYSPIVTVHLDVVEDGSPDLVSPTAADDTFQVVAGQTLAVASPGVLANDGPAPLHVANTGLPAPANGIFFQMSPAGGFTFTPAPGFSGTTSFEYRATDGVLESENATVTIEVLPAPGGDLPPYAGPAQFATLADTPLDISPAELTSFASDPDGDAIDVYLVVSGQFGTVSANPDDSIRFTPSPGFTGVATFAYSVVAGGKYSGFAPVTVFVSALDSELDAVDDEYEMTQNQYLEVSGAGVLINDTSSAGNALEVLGVDDQPDHGQLVFDLDGTFEYVPDLGFVGDDTFSYRISDGEGSEDVATVTIHVAGPAEPGDEPGELEQPAPPAPGAPQPPHELPVPLGSPTGALAHTGFDPAALIGIGLLIAVAGAAIRFGYWDREVGRRG